jgi:hypothetical protein
VKWSSRFDEVVHAAQHAHDADHRFGCDRVSRRRLDRRAQDAKRRRFVRCEQTIHELLVGVLDRLRGIRSRVQRRDAQHDGDVAALQVGVDQRNATDCVRCEQHREVRRNHGFADATLGRERDHDLTVARLRRGGGRGAIRHDGHVLADALDCGSNLCFAGVDCDCVTHSGPERTL